MYGVLDGRLHSFQRASIAAFMYGNWDFSVLVRKNNYSEDSQLHSLMGRFQREFKPPWKAFSDDGLLHDRDQTLLNCL